MSTNVGDKESNLVWVDLEMTGLDATKDKIIEMACIVTDKDLNILTEGPDLIIHAPDALMASMDEWCVKHHGESGLTQKVKESKLTTSEVEKTMLALIEPYTDAGKAILCGNSIHVDRRFLDAEMPAFSKHLHYRMIDVSTVKELARRWYPKAFDKAPEKKYEHRALGDIRESIKELKYYKTALFK